MCLDHPNITALVNLVLKTSYLSLFRMLYELTYISLMLILCLWSFCRLFPNAIYAYLMSMIILQVVPKCYLCLSYVYDHFAGCSQMLFMLILCLWSFCRLFPNAIYAYLMSMIILQVVPKCYLCLSYVYDHFAGCSQMLFMLILCLWSFCRLFPNAIYAYLMSMIILQVVPKCYLCLSYVYDHFAGCSQMLFMLILCLWSFCRLFPNAIYAYLMSMIILQVVPKC